MRAKKIDRCGEGDATTVLSLHFATAWRGKGGCCIRIWQGTKPTTGDIDFLPTGYIKEFKDGISRATTLIFFNKAAKI